MRQYASLYMRRLETKYLVVHCSATPPSMDIGVKEIRNWHKSRGWRDIGYHVVIRRSGHIEFGRPLDQEGAHVYGHNHNSVGICLIGGVDVNKQPENNFAEAQFHALNLMLYALLRRYPGAAIMGHRDFPEVAKACPSFDVRQWYSQYYVR